MLGHASGSAHPTTSPPDLPQGPPMRTAFLAATVCLFASSIPAQTANQPKVQPGPGEPDWSLILEKRYGLRMFDDLANPVKTTPEGTPGLFKKAGPGPVTYTPEIALGLEVKITGGYYLADGKKPDRKLVWSYQYKNTAKDVETGEHLPPPLEPKISTRFDPGDAPFGLWVGNDQFKDEVYSEPARVAAYSPRLAKQPYKAMIYPYRDKVTGKLVPHSYLIGWEYSTNDDFQDVVCRVDNVELVESKP